MDKNTQEAEEQRGDTGARERGEERGGEEEETLKKTMKKDNLWLQWAESIKSRVEGKIKLQSGDRDNPYYMPELVNYLMDDMDTICLWGCVCHQKFGWSGKPTSSAGVESDYNNVKNRIFKGLSLPIDVDEFIKIHTRHLEGKLYLIDNINGKATVEPFELEGKKV